MGIRIRIRMVVEMEMIGLERGGELAIGNCGMRRESIYAFIFLGPFLCS